MKKQLLLILCVLFCSTKLFGIVGIGFNVYGNFSDVHNIRNISEWGLGGSIGLGQMKGRPFILEVTGNSFGPNNAQIRAILDWHLFPINLLGILQVFFGLGVGTTFNFDPSNSHAFSDFDDDDWARNLNATIYGRIPVGVKLFLANFEIFATIAPQLGWNVKPNTFYWSFDLGTGVRIWF